MAEHPILTDTLKRYYSNYFLGRPNTFPNWFGATTTGDTMAAMNRSTAFAQLERVVDAGIPAIIRQRSFGAGGFFGIQVPAAAKAVDLDPGNPGGTPLDFNLYLPSEVDAYLSSVESLRKPQPLRASDVRTFAFPVGENQTVFLFRDTPNGYIRRQDNGLARNQRFYPVSNEGFTLEEIRQRKGILIDQQGKRRLVVVENFGPDGLDLFNTRG